MSTVELKFEGTFESSNYLKDFQCVNCNHYLSDKDIAESNYSLWVSDYSNELSRDEFYSSLVGRKLTQYNLTFWLKSVEHEYCPSD